MLYEIKQICANSQQMHNQWNIYINIKINQQLKYSNQQFICDTSLFLWPIILTRMTSYILIINIHIYMHLFWIEVKIDAVEAILNIAIVKNGSMGLFNGDTLKDMSIQTWCPAGAIVANSQQWRHQGIRNTPLATMAMGCAIFDSRSTHCRHRRSVSCLKMQSIGDIVDVIVNTLASILPICIVIVFATDTVHI